MPEREDHVWGAGLQERVWTPELLKDHEQHAKQMVLVVRAIRRDLAEAADSVLRVNATATGADGTVEALVRDYVSLTPRTADRNLIVAQLPSARPLALKLAAAQVAAALEILDSAASLLVSIDAAGDYAGKGGAFDKDFAAPGSGDSEAVSAETEAAYTSSDAAGLRLAGVRSTANLDFSGTGGATADNLAAGVDGEASLSQVGTGTINPTLAGVVGSAQSTEEIRAVIGVAGCAPNANDAKSRLGVVGGLTRAELLTAALPSGGWAAYFAGRVLVREQLSVVRDLAAPTGGQRAVDAETEAAYAAGDAAGLRLSAIGGRTQLVFSGTGGATADNLAAGVDGEASLSQVGTGTINPTLVGAVGSAQSAEQIRSVMGVAGCAPDANDAESRVGVVGGLTRAQLLSAPLPQGGWGGYFAQRVQIDGALHFGASGLSVAQILAGTGSPEGVAAAPAGSLFLRTDGGASTTLYVKESGAGNTGWAAK